MGPASGFENYAGTSRVFAFYASPSRKLSELEAGQASFLALLGTKLSSEMAFGPFATCVSLEVFLESGRLFGRFKRCCRLDFPRSILGGMGDFAAIMPIEPVLQILGDTHIAVSAVLIGESINVGEGHAWLARA